MTRGEGKGGMATERLTGLDASFLYFETPTQPLHVAMTLVFDPSTIPGGYSFSRLRQHIAERIPLAPVFQRRLLEVPFRLHHPVWVDDPDFDIDHHLRRAALPAPGGLLELGEFTGDVISRQLDRSKPLWEMWVVEGVEGGKVALVAKMHHSTVDGVSGAQLLGVILDLERAPANGHAPVAAETTPAPSPSKVPSSTELVGQAVLARMVKPFEVTRLVMRTGQSVVGVVRVRRRSSGKAALPLTAPRTSINQSVGARRRVAFAAVGLADVKHVKNALGATVNDVVLAICTGALRRYLDGRGELPDIPLVSVVPVSVGQDLPDLPGSNKVSAMFVGLPTHVEDPLERVRLIQEDTKTAKDEHAALGASTLQNWAEHATPNLFSLAMRLYCDMHLADRHRPVANLVVSNVPGPDFPLYLAGAEMLAGFPLGPVVDGMGLNITIMSYRGVLYWGFAADSRSVPRVWDIAGAVPVALDELLGAAGLETQPTDLRLRFGSSGPAEPVDNGQTPTPDRAPA